jgi:hypothetical protein
VSEPFRDLLHQEFPRVTFEYRNLSSLTDIPVDVDILILSGYLTRSLSFYEFKGVRAFVKRGGLLLDHGYSASNAKVNVQHVLELFGKGGIIATGSGSDKTTFSTSSIDDVDEDVRPFLAGPAGNVASGFDNRFATTFIVPNELRGHVLAFDTAPNVAVLLAFSYQNGKVVIFIVFRAVAESMVNRKSM